MSFLEEVQETTCRDPGLNQGPSDLQSDALPTELSRLFRVNRRNFWVRSLLINFVLILVYSLSFLEICLAFKNSMGTN